MSKRRMVGWQPLAVENTATATMSQASAEPEPVQATRPPETAQQTSQPQAPIDASEGVTAAPASPAGPIQDPDVARRRMAGWQPLTVAHAAPMATPMAATPADSSAGTTESSAPAETPSPVDQPAAASPAPVAAPPVTEDLPRRRMSGWEPLKVGHPDSVAAAAEIPPAAEPSPAPVAQETAAAGSRRRMGAAPAAAAPAAAAVTPAAGQSAEVKSPGVVTPEPVKPAASQPAGGSVQAEPKRGMSKVTKVVLTLLGVAVVAAGVVLLAQWARTLDPVASFIATYDGTPTPTTSTQPW